MEDRLDPHGVAFAHDAMRFRWDDLVISLVHVYAMSYQLIGPAFGEQVCYVWEEWGWRK